MQVFAYHKRCIVVVLESEMGPVFPALCVELNPAVIFQSIFFSFSFGMDSYLQNH